MIEYKVFKGQTPAEQKQFFCDFSKELEKCDEINREAVTKKLSDESFLAFVKHHADHDTILSESLRNALSKSMINCIDHMDGPDISYLELLSSISVSALNTTPKGELSNPLGYAANQRFVKTMEMFVRNGADLNACGPLGSVSALQMAASCDKIHSLNKLIELGAIIDLQNAEGNTALLLASAFQASGAVELLIAAGADIHHQNKANETALSIVCLSYFNEGTYYDVEKLVEIALILMKFGADINHPDILEGLNDTLDSLEDELERKKILSI